MTEREYDRYDRTSTASVQHALESAVAKTLERKRRLGQYAVVIRDGRTVRLGIDVPWDQESDQRTEHSAQP
ncbi:hypothetical protein [Thioalkalivibrio sp. ALM2T]|uniref:hypothetical protein n=1 Tax=Thioalkalivibrio sp. ALM2T TaxID=1158184 RepID=UPI000370F716|nr:hypothetical protein [Thioalkalivibrio sp. ALM2T]